MSEDYGPRAYGPSRGPIGVGPGRLPPAVGKRVAFPLPLPPVEEKPQGASGTRLRRWRHRRRHADLVRDAFSALNWLGKTKTEGTKASVGETSSLPSPSIYRHYGSFEDASGFDVATLNYVEELARLQLPTASEVVEKYPPPHVAFAELLRGRGSAYGAASAAPTLSPFRRGQVSLPEDVGASPNINQIVGARGRWYLEGAGERMRDATLPVERDYATDTEKCYTDPALTRDPRVYARFVRDLKKRGLVRFVHKAHSRVGLFFVKKKSGQLRLIIDARRPNDLFDEPPGVDMVTSEGLGRIEVVGAPLGDDGVPLFCGTADVADAFHRMVMPRWLGDFFGLPPLRAGTRGSR